MTQSATPNLFEILSKMQADITTITIEVMATRQMLGKRRLPSGSVPKDTPQSIALAMQAKLEWHFDQLMRPIPLHHLARSFARKLSALELDTDTVLALMPNAHIFASGSGGRMVMPLSDWNAVSQARQAEWLGLTSKHIERQRLEDIKAKEAYEESVNKELRRMQREDFDRANGVSIAPSPQAFQAQSAGKFETPQVHKLEPVKSSEEGRVVVDPADAFSSEGEDAFGIYKPS